MGDLNSTECTSVVVEKTINHYSSSHRILLVGEGDFSFSACLATAFGFASNMVATSLDSKEWLLWTYTHVMENLKNLEELGCMVVHEVDATTMSEHPRLHHTSFDRIVFNFPHAGFYFPEQIELHQNLVREFLKNAKELLAENGEIHITHKTSRPCSEWEIEKLAEDESLFLKEEVDFCKLSYPGYMNKRGSGPYSNRTFRIRSCSTFKFAKSMARLETRDQFESI